MRLVLTLASLIIAAGPAAAANQFPSSYQGVWMATDGPTAAAPNAQQCKASDFEEHTNDGLVSVNKSSVKYWESGCDLNSMTQTSIGTLNLGLSCTGEGESYKTREIWAVHKVAGIDVLVMTIPARSSVALYTKCK